MNNIKELFHLKDNINDLTKEKDKLLSMIYNLQLEVNSLSNQKQSLEEANNELFNLNNTYNALEECSYNYILPDNITSNIAEDKLIQAEKVLGELIANGKAISCNRQYRINNSVAKGTRFQETYGKNMLCGFNTYFNKKCKSITTKNYSNTIDLITKCYNKFNKQGELLNISITPVYLQQCLSIMELKLNLKLVQADEKEKIRQEKVKLKEQERLLEEIAKEREKLAKERRYYEAIYGETNSDEKRLEIKEQLAKIDTREQDLDYREKNQKAGWLYVAYTPAMPNCVKLGVTRRYSPLVRLQELSSASVPFPFECKGLVFSDDVFTLEANIHSYFENKRVNKENRHKEFFFITPEEAIVALKEVYHCQVIFINGEETLDI